MAALGVAGGELGGGGVAGAGQNGHPGRVSARAWVREHAHDAENPMAGSVRRAKAVTGKRSGGAATRHSGEQRSGGAERGRGRKQDREVLYHSAELQRRSNGEGEQ